MPNDSENPLVGHVLGQIEDRRMADVAKLELLRQIASRLDDINTELAGQSKRLEKLVQQTRKR